MPGLDQKVVDLIKAKRVIERIKIDVRTDFIVAPHYNAIFLKAGDYLWGRAQELLRSGNYVPALPHTISVPKERGFARPGSILSPIDRFVYQALIDLASPALEKQLDRTRTFSNVLSKKQGAMFEPAHEGWERLQGKIAQLCAMGGFILKADIANYFERIPQHHLVNLMNAAGCRPEVVNLIEEMLLAFQERDSYGIIQGVFPSDVLGNFFLSEFDAYCELHDLPSARYVDDIYIRYPTDFAARNGLISLTERLRQNGLHLNEYKSGILTATAVQREETQLDALFAAARQEVQRELTEGAPGGYGFNVEWEFDEPPTADDDLDLAAVERLYQAIGDNPKHADKIEKYCLPLLRAAGSDVAVASVLRHLPTNGHLSRLYYTYLTRFLNHAPLVRALEKLAQRPQMGTDFQRMYVLAALFSAKSISKGTVNLSLQWLENAQIAQEARAMAAVFAAKFGTGNQKRAVRLMYEREPSEYVRSAILYSARYFSTPEKRACKKAWGGHTVVNSLVVQAM